MGRRGRRRLRGGMTYTVHLGHRSEEWPQQIAEAFTRAEAQRLAGRAVLAATHEDKAQVRLRVMLLDVYGRRGESSVRHIYEARQRAAIAA